jgi:outer membrane protein OmpA-like peptidoglycan-associated protein
VSIAKITPANSLNDILTKKKFVTHAIHFDPGRSAVRHESIGFIRELARFLQQNPSVVLRIDGHTDSDGSATANMTLSHERAEEVKRLLISSGIEEQRISTKGYGSTKPVKPNTNPENKAENRRVEFIRL